MIHLVALALVVMVLGRAEDLGAEVPAIAWRGAPLGVELALKEQEGSVLIGGDRRALRFDLEGRILAIDRAAFAAVPAAARALAEVEAAARLDLATGEAMVATRSGLSIRPGRGAIIDAASSGDGRSLAALASTGRRLALLPFLSAGRTGGVVRLIVTGAVDEDRLLRLDDDLAAHRLLWGPGDRTLIVFDALHTHFVMLPLDARGERR